MYISLRYFNAWVESGRLHIQTEFCEGGSLEAKAWYVFKTPLMHLSSPRAESARASTGRRNSHSGRGEDFLSCQPIFFTETAVTPERKVEKWFPRWEINRHAEG